MASGQPVQFALECKEWWVRKILSGEKTVEVRQYSLPAQLLGVPVWLAATSGTDGPAALGDRVAAGQPGGELLGWVVFSGVHEYSSQEGFQSDERRHCVGNDSVYAWREGETQQLFGWEVGSCHALEAPAQLPSMRRLQRSIYELESH